MRAVLLLATVASEVDAHGHLTLPASTRHGGTLAKGGDCTNGACFWFSNNVQIPFDEPRLPNDMRSIQLNVTGQPQDVYAKSPWRAPGSAPVYGSGCGSAGGGPTAYANGGNPPRGVEQGLDGLTLPKNGKPAVFKRGAEVEVAWAIAANHGGGYAYRLCKADGNITEQCFQAGHLEFAGQSQWIRYPNGSQAEMPLRMTDIGTTPSGSQWARDPVPQCYECDAYETCGAPLPPDPSPKSDAEAEKLEAPDDELQGRGECKPVAPAECGTIPGNNTCLKCASAANDTQYRCAECCPGTVMKQKYGGKIEFCGVDQCASLMQKECGSTIGKDAAACEDCAFAHMANFSKLGCTGSQLTKICAAAPAPSPAPPAQDGCAKALDGFCGTLIGSKRCGACASSHRPQLDKAGCSGPEVIKLCEGAKPEDGCTKELKDLCGPLIGSPKCGTCASSHKAELTKAGCSGPEVISICKGSGGKPKGANAWDAQVNCDANCAGAGTSSRYGPGCSATAFPEPLPGISGFGKVVWPWSIVGTRPLARASSAAAF